MPLRQSPTCLFLLMMMSGCAGSLPEPSSKTPEYRLGQQAGEPLLLRGADLTGPTTSIRFAEGAARGRFQDAPLDVSWTDTRLTGTAGNRATQITLEGGEKTRVWGFLGGVRVDYTLTADRMEGQVGLCVYTMNREPGGFVGQRHCSGPLEAAFAVHFPEPLLSRPLGETALLMTLVFVNTTGTYSRAGAIAPRVSPPDRVNRQSSSPSGFIHQPPVRPSAPPAAPSQPASPPPRPQP